MFPPGLSILHCFLLVVTGDFRRLDASGDPQPCSDAAYTEADITWDWMRACIQEQLLRIPRLGTGGAHGGHDGAGAGHC